jgi:hypothetical protein
MIAVVISFSPPRLIHCGHIDTVCSALWFALLEGDCFWAARLAVMT